MSKFMLTVGAREMANQIARMINIGGQLAHTLTADTILFNRIKYVVEMRGEEVAGVIGLENFGRVTEMKHLCVHPSYRRQGLGRKLLEKGIAACPTEFVFGMVRSDNHSNIRNNLRVGMVPIGKKRGRGCHIIIFARRKNERIRQRVHTAGS